MSLFSDNPEWFDEWIERRALDGDFGVVIRDKVEEGTLIGSDLWEMASNEELFPSSYNLGAEASQDYCERLVP